ncbi:MAG: endonuclease NucS [Halobacteriales archaeon]
MTGRNSHGERSTDGSQPAPASGGDGPDPASGEDRPDTASGAEAPERTASGEHQRVRTTTAPSHEEAREVAAAALERGDLLTVVGRCTVDYDGRVATTLGPGDRHLMLKPDGTAMVHTEEGRQPVNWQPPGSDHAVERGDGRLRVRLTREAPEETLVVDFESVWQVAAFDVVDEADLALSGTHEDLKARVLERPDLVEPGFAPLATERETATGALDVYGEDADGRPVVLELKRSRAGPDAVSQLARYVDAVARELHDDATVRGVLVAPSATESARAMLAERDLDFAAVDTRPPE